MIKPTVGRPVLYNAGESQSHAATIAFVHNDELVNIGGFDSRGVHFNEQNVKFCQSGEVICEGECQFEDINAGSFAHQLAAKSMASHFDEALESGDAEIIEEMSSVALAQAEETAGMIDGAEVKTYGESEALPELSDIPGQLINRQLASHQMNQVVQ